MLAQPHPQMPFGEHRQQISPIIAAIVREARWSEITGIFAYSTAGGLLELLTPIEGLSPAPSLRWLFGLDDCLTGHLALGMRGHWTLVTGQLSVVSGPSSAAIFRSLRR